MIGAKGVLILGNSGSGKSTLVHALIAHASRENQFARWVGDDQLIIQNEAGSVVAHAADTISGKAEQPFNGILDVPYVPSARIDLIVQLRDEADLERMPGEITDTPFPDYRYVVGTEPHDRDQRSTHLQQVDLLTVV